MYIDRILAPIKALGPGERLVIWTKGCSKHCAGCANPELWSTENAKDYSVDEILKIIVNIYNQNKFDGITISGGDPLEQKDDILELLKGISNITEDVLLYTGYCMSDLKLLWKAEEIQRLKELAAVIIDGPYEESLNYAEAGLRGSANQTIHYFKKQYRKLYEEYISQGRKVQNVYMGNRLISVGIHNRKDENDIEEEQYTKMAAGNIKL